MEHKLITGGEQWLPFARSRIKALRATGLAYASQKFEIEGALIDVRIEPGHEYIRIEGGDYGDIILVFKTFSGATSGLTGHDVATGPGGVNACQLVIIPNHTPGDPISIAGYHFFSAKIKGILKTPKFKPLKYQLAPKEGGVYFEVRGGFDGQITGVKYDTESTSTSYYAPALHPQGMYRYDQVNSSHVKSYRQMFVGPTALGGGLREFYTTSRFQAIHYDNDLVPFPNQDDWYSSGFEVFSEGTSSDTGVFERAAVDIGLDAQHRDRVLNLEGPWCSWNAAIGYFSNGTQTTTYDVHPGPPTTTVTGGFTTSRQIYKLTAKRSAPEGVDPSKVLPRENIDQYREWYSADVAGAPPTPHSPIDRHTIDFGFLANRIDGLKIRSVCRDVAYCWEEEGGNPDLPGPKPILVVNYKTGQTHVVDAPQLFPPSGPETDLPGIDDYTAPNVMFLDDYIILVKNDPVTPHFWLYLYSNVPGGSEDPSTNIKLLRLVTNKPGDLTSELEAFEMKVLAQVVIEGLPSPSFLIGAVRDEVSCM